MSSIDSIAQRTSGVYKKIKGLAHRPGWEGQALTEQTVMYSILRHPGRGNGCWRTVLVTNDWITAREAYKAEVERLRQGRGKVCGR